MAEGIIYAKGKQAIVRYFPGKSIDPETGEQLENTVFAKRIIAALEAGKSVAVPRCESMPQHGYELWDITFVEPSQAATVVYPAGESAARVREVLHATEYAPRKKTHGQQMAERYVSYSDTVDLDTILFRHPTNGTNVPVGGTGYTGDALRHMLAAVIDKAIDEERERCAVQVGNMTCILSFDEANHANTLRNKALSEAADALRNRK